MGPIEFPLQRLARLYASGASQPEGVPFGDR